MEFLKSSSDECFDNLTNLAASISGSPFSVVCLADGDCVWYKSSYGIETSVTRFKGSFTEAVLSGEDILALSDASLDPRFTTNKFVQNGLKFYLGVPISFKNTKIGTLSIGDVEAREVDEKTINHLRILAKQVEREIERIHNTALIKASENKYRSVTQSINDGVVTCDGNGIIVSWNKAAELIFEHSETEAIGKSIDMLIPPEFRELHNRGMMDFVAQNGTKKSHIIGKTLELYGMKKSGKKFPLELSISFWMDNESLMLTAILRDITERKQQLKELSDARDNLERKVSERTADLKILMESIPEIVWEANKDGFINYMSPKWELVTGLKFDEGSWEYFLHQDDIKETLAKWEAALEKGETYEAEYRLRQSDGSYRWILARAVPLIRNSEVIKWFGSLTDIHERKIVNDIQNNFFALPDLMLCLAGPDGYFKKLNAAWEKTLGFTVEELQSRPLIDFIHPDDVEKTVKELGKLAQGQGSFNFENRYSCKNGSYIWLHWTSVIRDGLYYCVARDITYLKNAEIILRESELRFKSILEQSPIPTQLINTQGGISKVNRAWKDLWEVPEEQMSDLIEVYNIHTDELMDKLSIRSHINEAFKGRAVVVPPVLYDPRLFNRPGRKRWVKVFLNPIFKYDGSLSEVLLMFLDITDQKMAENEIRTKQSELQSILDNSSSVVVLKDLEGKYLLVNSEFERIFNVRAADVIGKHDSEFFPQEFVEKYVHNDQFVLENGVSLREEETAPLADGIHTFLSAKFPIFDGEGKVRAMGGIATDITSIKKFEVERSLYEIREKASQETSKLKSEFLANMSHEIRTPINGVVGMTGLLLDTTLTEEQKDYADHIRRCGETLLTVINDILDFSKIEAGKLDFDNIDFDLLELVNDSLVTVSFSAKKKGLSLVSEFDSNLPRYLVGDPGRLKQILMNLLSNGVKFTHEGKIALVCKSLSEEGESVRLRFEVHDSGIGISQENIGKLFRPFSQADGSTQRKYGGTGLGLSICKKLVDHWSGEIGVESEEGKGSTFWIEVPLKVSEKHLLRRSKSIAAPFRKARILVAEDNPVNQMIAVKMLKKLGHYADVAGNGFEALDALRNAPYDLILMDCQMPECDGYEATRIIRTAPEFSKKHHVILAMTANAMTGDAEKCIASGMDGYISKPVSAEKLNEIINEWLSK